MIPKFKDFVELNESKNMMKIIVGNTINKNNYTFKDIKSKFIDRGYDYLGMIEIYIPSYDFGKIKPCKEITDSVPKNILKILRNYYDIDNYLSYAPKPECVSFSFRNEDLEDRLKEVLSQPNIEKITSCENPSGVKHVHIVLWNDEKKYFYCVVPEGTWLTNTDLYGFVELWLKIRTSGIEEIKKEVKELKFKGVNGDMKKSFEKDEEERLNHPEEYAHNKLVKAIEADVKKNPSNYEEIDYEDLPDEIKTELEKESSTKYAVYIEHISTDPYMREDVICYINDAELSKGYKYYTAIDHSHSGQYWGD